MLRRESPTLEEAMPDLSAHEAIYSLRAMRRLKPDAVPEDDLRYIVDAATQAPSAAEASAWFGSIYPAIQNLMLAARARGLGTTLTTLHKLRENDVKDILGIPAAFETIALIPVGYPQGRWGRPLRGPSSAVTHWDRWEGRHPDA
jgi:nitroreductase